MVLVDVLVGGAQGVGQGIQGLEGQEVQDGILGGRDDAQSLGEVQVILEVSVGVGVMILSLLTLASSDNRQDQHQCGPRDSNNPFCTEVSFALGLVRGGLNRTISRAHRFARSHLLPKPPPHLSHRSRPSSRVSVLQRRVGDRGVGVLGP